jgi:hypothetical protein
MQKYQKEEFLNTPAKPDVWNAPAMYKIKAKKKNCSSQPG